MDKQTKRVRRIAWWIASFFSFVASAFMFLNGTNKVNPWVWVTFGFAFMTFALITPKE